MILKIKNKLRNDENEINYDRLLMLFMAGCILGVLLEGIFCIITKGHWESHVVSVIGAFNILYGTGAVLFYVGAVMLKSKPMLFKVAVMAVSATALELTGGLLLRYGLGMRAWNYDGSFMNYKGMICLGFSLIWAFAAFVFCKLEPRISKKLEKIHGKKWHFVCAVVGVFMALNLALTMASIVRWSQRHYGIPADSKIEEFLDRDAPDDWMKSRFMEWEFLDNIIN